jgi:putative glutathione S-transferase
MTARERDVPRTLLAQPPALGDGDPMGRLIEGVWSTEWYTPDEKGRFVRGETAFRDRVSADGSTGFLAEAGRYHLYVSYACPWAHRTLIVRKLLGLEEAIGISVVHPFMGRDGWSFDEAPGTIPDPIHGARFLWEIYTHARAGYTGRVTVPVLWDKQKKTIVNNESREIIRMFDTAFSGLTGRRDTLCPEALRERIDQTIDAIYTPVNNGVYRAGFATQQGAYEEAVSELFAALAHWDAVLGERRYLLGDQLTEADICLFTTLLRFDPVYHGHFKCNLRRLADFDNLWGFVRDVYQTPGVAETCRIDHIKQHYYQSHDTINPTRIVPLGPILDLDAPHDRDRRFR